MNKGWSTLCGYVRKQDRSPIVWGKFSLNEILREGEASRKHRRTPVMSTALKQERMKRIFKKIDSDDNFLHLRKDPEIAELLLSKYSTVRMGRLTAHEDAGDISYGARSSLSLRERAAPRIDRRALARKVKNARLDSHKPCLPEAYKDKAALCLWSAKYTENPTEQRGGYIHARLTLLGRSAG